GEVDRVEQVGGERVGLGCDEAVGRVDDRSGPGPLGIGIEQVGRRAGGHRAQLVAAVLAGDLEAGDQVVPQRAGGEFGVEVGLVEPPVIYRVARLGLGVDQ